MRFGVSPDVASKAIGLTLFPLTLLASCGLCLQICENKALAVYGTFLLALNYTFAGYATGGLETQLQCLLAVCLFWQSIRLRNEFKPISAVLFALCAVLSILCRLDSLIFTSVCYGFAFFTGERSDRRTSSGVWVGAFLLALLALWTCWRLSYFGQPLPNTFYVKAGGLHIVDGLKFFATFAWSYWIGPFHFALLGFLWVKSRDLPAVRFLIVLLGTWCAYVLYVGGDFMEFRFMVVVMPVFVALLMRGLAEPTLRVWAGLSLLTQFVNPHPNWEAHDLKTNSSIPKLAHEISGPTGWIAIGKKLHQAFGANSNVVIGVTAAGAIPYYSELETVDMLGLNDREVTQRGLRVKDRPGHEVKATVALLREKGVNLVFSHPQLVPLNDVAHLQRYAYYFKWHFRADPEFPTAYQGAKLVAIPLNEDTGVIAWYLTPSAQVDAAASAGHWPMVTVMGPPY